MKPLPKESNVVSDILFATKKNLSLAEFLRLIAKDYGYLTDKYKALMAAADKLEKDETTT